ncbi:acyltransferase family protein [Algirhabdus cladophorae]|uniref:acyltransferase family protein n=1 Tax=Algirhabdus cladophorae TaxID=3377108 RepID=UPI003B8494B1
MKYRPEIDGLRSLAVVPVIFYHADPQWMPGGYVGVDVFFVISGYLICTILLTDLDLGRFSIKTFYERRARRILPALFFVMLASLPFAWAWMPAQALKDFAQSLAATVLFGSNILFWSEQNYFSPASELKPLLHTWSLAVEEQFYVFFPLILWALWRFGLRVVLGCFVALGLISLIAAEWAVRNEPSAAFYLTPFRTWELMVGVFCAIISFRREVPANQYLAALGLGLLVYANLFFTTQTPVPGLPALVPVLGTGLIILFARPATWVGLVLSNRVLVGFGLLSYSAYLWHQPIFAFARLRSPLPPDAPLLLALIVLTFVLAWGTWRFVERPFRVNRAGTHVSLRTVVAGTLAGTAVFVGLGAFGHVNNGFGQRVAPSGLTFDQATAMVPTGHRTDCGIDLSIHSQPDVLPLEQCRFLPDFIQPLARVVLIGDSHAEAMSSAVVQNFVDRGWQVDLLLFRGCPPFYGVTTPGTGCNGHATRLIEFLETEKAEIDLILAAFRPQGLFAKPFDNGEGGHERAVSYAVPIYEDAYLGIAPETPNVNKAQILIQKGMARLLEIGPPLMAIYPVPEAGWYAGEIIEKYAAFYDSSQYPSLSTSYAVFKDRNAPIIETLDAITSPRLRRVYPDKVFCNQAQKGRCGVIEDGVALYEDDDHISSAGTQLLMPQIMAHVDELGLP